MHVTFHVPTEKNCHLTKKSKHLQTIMNKPNITLQQQNICNSGFGKLTSFEQLTSNPSCFCNEGCCNNSDWVIGQRQLIPAN